MPCATKCSKGCHILVEHSSVVDFVNNQAKLSVVGSQHHDVDDVGQTTGQTNDQAQAAMNQLHRGSDLVQAEAAAGIIVFARLDGGAVLAACGHPAGQRSAGRLNEHRSRQEARVVEVVIQIVLGDVGRVEVFLQTERFARKRVFQAINGRHAIHFVRGDVSE